MTVHICIGTMKVINEGNGEKQIAYDVQHPLNCEWHFLDL